MILTLEMLQDFLDLVGNPKCPLDILINSHVIESSLYNHDYKSKYILQIYYIDDNMKLKSIYFHQSIITC